MQISEWGRKAVLYHRLVIFLAGFLVVLIAWPTQFYFLNDDFVHVPQAGAGRFATGTLLRPVSDFTLWCDYRLWGKQAAGYHLTNLLIHLANGCLFFFFSKNLEQRKGQVNGKVLFATVLFLVYSYHSEPLFWIIGRGGSLTTFFLLLSLLALQGSASRPGMVAVALVFFGVGFFTYETVWVLPFILLLAFSLKEDIGVNKKKLAFFWLLFLALLVVRFGLLKKDAGQYEAGVFLQQNWGRLLYNWNTLLARCFLPPMASGRLFALLYLLLLLVLVAAIWKANSRRAYFYAIALVVSLTPVLTLGIDTHDSESERFIYGASVFAVLLLGELLSRLPQKTFLALGTGLILFHLSLLWANAQNYKFSGSVARQSLACIRNENAPTLIVENLPSQYRGAFIFRTGFAEAIRWINSQRPQQLIVQNTMEYEQRFAALRCMRGAPAGRVFGDKDTVLLQWRADSLLIYVR